MGCELCPSLGCPTGSFLHPQSPHHAWKEVQVFLLPAGGVPDGVPGADDRPDRGAPGPALPQQKHQWQVQLSQPLQTLCSRAGFKLKGGQVGSPSHCRAVATTSARGPFSQPLQHGCTALGMEGGWLQGSIPSFHPPFPLSASSGPPTPRI